MTRSFELEDLIVAGAFVYNRLDVARNGRKLSKVIQARQKSRALPWSRLPLPFQLRRLS